MYVLIDIEWIQQNEEVNISQFAAARVMEGWAEIADFQHLVCPANPQETDWSHMAYNGYLPDAFAAGISERDCILDFLGFLDADDLILCWHSDTKRLLRKKCKLYTGAPVSNKIKCLNNRVHILAMEKGLTSLGLYPLATEMGINAPCPEHKSVNDVSVLISLLSTLGYDQNNPPGQKQMLRKQAVSRRERNTHILSRTNYNYIFTPESQIFHKTDCRLILNASAIQGCVYYKNAVKNRRPCKICRPEPPESTTPVKQAKARTSPGKECRELPMPTDKAALRKQTSTAPMAVTETALRKQNNVLPAEAAGQQRKTNTLPQTERKPGPQPPEKRLVMVKLLGDQWIEIANTKLVGCCHNMIHPGKLTRKIMEEHDCIGKNCPFFEKYANSSFWSEQESKKRRKAEQKAAQQLRKEAARKQMEELENLKLLLQSYADSTVHKIQIIRIEKELQNRYKLFYVSEFPFADGNRFPDFLQTVKNAFPRYRIQLRHIRDVDGHFVTVDEYVAMRKQRK